MDVNLGPFIHDPMDFNDPAKMLEHTKQLAYHFWVKHGHPDGQSDKFWKMAERDIAKQKRALEAYTETGTLTVNSKERAITHGFIDGLYERLKLKSKQIQDGTAEED